MTSTTVSSSFSNLIRTDFWFADGTIVLIAQNAAFKVHKGQLARHSEVFSGLFSLPQPLSMDHGRGASPAISKGSSREDLNTEKGDSGDIDLIDGCPFVVLQDSPSDVFYFLSALYDGLYFAPPNLHTRPNPSTFPSLSAVLRLSKKYLIEPLIQRCLFHLSLDWPISLVAWDDRETRFTVSPPPPSSKNSRGNGGRYLPREFCPHPILIIHFALEMNLPDILPAAMYDLSRYGPSKIVNGASTPPTTFDRLFAQLASSGAPTNLKPTPVRLSKNLLYQILRGREETQRFLASFIEKELYFRPPSSSCYNVSSTATQSNSQSQTAAQTRTTNPCTDSFYYILLNILRSVGGISFGREADALFTLTQAAEMLDRTDFYVAGSSSSPSSSNANSYAGSEGSTTNHGQSQSRRTFGLKICQPCKLDFRECVRKAREEMWNCLPRWFGLVGSHGETEEGNVQQV